MKKLALQKRLLLSCLLSWVACVGLLVAALFVHGKWVGLVLAALAFAALVAQSQYVGRVWRCPSCDQPLPHIGGMPPVRAVTQCPYCKRSLDREG